MESIPAFELILICCNYEATKINLCFVDF